MATTLKRELQHIEFLILGFIETDLDFDTLNKIKNYIEGRIESLSE